jgi:hypothetical protein
MLKIRRPIQAWKMRVLDLCQNGASVSCRCHRPVRNQRGRDGLAPKFDGDLKGDGWQYSLTTALSGLNASARGDGTLLLEPSTLVGIAWRAGVTAPKCTVALDPFGFWFAELEFADSIDTLDDLQRAIQSCVDSIAAQIAVID